MRGRGDAWKVLEESTPLLSGDDLTSLIGRIKKTCWELMSHLLNGRLIRAGRKEKDGLVGVEHEL